MKTKNTIITVVFLILSLQCRGELIEYDTESQPRPADVVFVDAEDLLSYFIKGGRYSLLTEETKKLEKKILPLSVKRLEQDDYFPEVTILITIGSKRYEATLTQPEKDRAAKALIKHAGYYTGKLSDATLVDGCLYDLRQVKHPVVLEFARNMVNHENEVIAKQAQLLVTHQEGRSKPKKSRSWQPRSRDSFAVPHTNSPDSSKPETTNTVATQSSSWSKWLVILVVLLVFGGIFIWLKAKTRA